ncbi:MULTISPECIES: DUF3310 domain-containing protein [unclassified Marinobacter]|uniref:DUF3310 domain-containing protein n=1 Tax=unclassified Marinobacter TaxID=83889 RepID=UPI001268CA87|nr:MULTISPECIES: DUF3310 domain-containing protein [unclassified Marinobacter]QFS86602.1 hypothetical protein FIV08_07120 [Marinobacter sp. THAF197a]QFT50386.1 hypothetical protein FIU96_07050 [Marinobacter sp. THAF39]QFT52908.1 hypothetical protein FIU96_19855 [Marinobacter sp. THAF39]
MNDQIIPASEADDAVNNPKHYQLLPGVEVIDVRDVLLNKITTTGFMNHRQSDYWSRSWEYLTRCMEKGGVEDLKKSRFYLERLIQDMEDSAQ